MGQHLRRPTRQLLGRPLGRRTRPSTPILILAVLLLLSPLAIFGAIFWPARSSEQVSAAPAWPADPASPAAPSTDGDGAPEPAATMPTLQVPEPDPVPANEPPATPQPAAEAGPGTGDSGQPGADRQGAGQQGAGQQGAGQQGAGQQGAGQQEAGKSGTTGSGTTGSGTTGSGQSANEGGRCVSSGGSFTGVTRFQLSRMGVDVPLRPVGEDSTGAPGAPPLNQMYSAAWYNKSPRPGSGQGNVIINIHSWASGAALGNDLRTGIRSGDVIRVVGDGGQVACYRFRDMIKFRVADYDPRSGIYHNKSGRPQLAIMTCWDRNKSTGEYESRVIMYADYVARA
ncbi:class F sortase [Granulicoccus phenolivorans]|uniref:class F sortase n=1 Tax=Granulicoccus phenolivorans TaxID=266854 RepID=UPI0003FCCB34|nr:class F sortase [Granulicoccus phenolivorans]